MELNEIPIELYSIIVKYLDEQSIINLSYVNKNFNTLLINNINIIKNEYYIQNYNKLVNMKVPFNICHKLMYFNKYKINKIFNFINDEFICYNKFSEMCIFKDETINLMFHYKNTLKYINKSTQNDFLIYDLGIAYENSYKNIIDEYIQMNIPLDIIHNIIRWPYIKTFVFKNIIKVINHREAYVLIENDYTKKELDMIVKLINNKIINLHIFFNISNYTNEQIDNIIKKNIHLHSAHLKL
jgi:hypothetical protein